MKVLATDWVYRYAGRLRKDAVDACRERPKVLKNFTALFTADVLSKLLTLLAVGYLARTLDSDTFGRIALAESLLFAALLTADFGLEWYGVREIARSQAPLCENVATVCTLRLVLFACVITVFAFLPVFLRKPADVGIMIWLFGLGLVPNALYHVRLVASNSAGVSFAADQAFMTAKDPAPNHEKRSNLGVLRFAQDDTVLRFFTFTPRGVSRTALGSKRSAVRLSSFATPRSLMCSRSTQRSH